MANVNIEVRRTVMTYLPAMTRKDMKIEYSWDDFYDLFREINVQWNVLRKFDDPNMAIKYYIDCKYQAYGPDILERVYNVFFVAPLEDMPLYINEEIPISFNGRGTVNGTIMLYMIAKWRLKRGL